MGRVLYRDGLPITFLAGADVKRFETLHANSEWVVGKALLRGALPKVFARLW